MTKLPQSGYVPCKCRDCFEIAIASDVARGAFCHECEAAGCMIESPCDGCPSLTIDEPEECGPSAADERGWDAREE